MTVEITPSGRVNCVATLHLPLSSSVLWGQLRDFHRYACHDFFHATIETLPARELHIVHQFLGVTIHRVGRICRWEEGVGYAFSDLSRLGPKHGFPHVFSYRLTPEGPAASLLHIRVSGRWTARAVPRWLARLWLRWVFAKIIAGVESDLLLAGVAMSVAQGVGSAAPSLRRRRNFHPRRTASARPV